MVSKLLLSVPQYCGIARGEEDKQNDLRRNRITTKIILAQSDEASGKKDKLQQKEF